MRGKNKWKYSYLLVFSIFNLCVCVCACYFSPTLAFIHCRMSMMRARLLQNVKQAEGNILHLLPFAFHAYLIKNDFFFAQQLQYTTWVMLYLSLSTCLKWWLIAVCHSHRYRRRRRQRCSQFLLICG